MPRYEALSLIAVGPQNECMFRQIMGVDVIFNFGAKNLGQIEVLLRPNCTIYPAPFANDSSAGGFKLVH
jgi:hypothetical protein